MTNISFPLTFQELKEMRKDGDWISSAFSYACLISLALSILFFGFSYLLMCRALSYLAVVLFMLAVISLLGVSWYRPKFLACKEQYEEEYLADLYKKVEGWMKGLKEGKHKYTMNLKPSSFSLSEIASKFSAKESAMEMVVKKLLDRNLCQIRKDGMILI